MSCWPMLTPEPRASSSFLGTVLGFFAAIGYTYGVARAAATSVGFVIVTVLGFFAAIGYTARAYLSLKQILPKRVTCAGG